MRRQRLAHRLLVPHGSRMKKLLLGTVPIGQIIAEEGKNVPAPGGAEHIEISLHILLSNCRQLKSIFFSSQISLWRNGGLGCESGKRHELPAASPYVAVIDLSN